MADLSARTGLGQRGKGATGRWAEESRKRARDSGELPHEFLLRVARGEGVDLVEETEDGSLRERTYYPSFTDRVECATACANYFAPKLTAQQVENIDGAEELSDEDIARQLEALMTGKS